MLIFLFAICFFFIFCFLAIRHYYRSQLLETLHANQTIQAELTQLHASEKKLKTDLMSLDHRLNQSLEDPITHLLGWQLFEDRLNQSIKESERYQFYMGLLFVDIDDFKMINDGLSYKAGDQLLREVALRLEACIRKVDSIARLAKDTYVILLPQLAKPETAVVVAQRILQGIVEPFNINDQSLYITVSIGIAIYPTDGKEAESLMRSADHALHLAKQKGKFSYQFYAEKLHEQSQRELALYTYLSHENIYKDFIIYYQPVIDIETQKIFCMEAKLYLKHPTLGMIGPTELFSYAGKQRRLLPLLEWLLKSIVKQFTEWRNIDFQPKFIAIAISLKLLENSPFIYRMSQIFQELEFDPKYLLLEVDGKTEPISYDIFEKAFNMLKYIGINIGINNFGKGELPLSFLKWIPLSYLKIGTTIIADLNSPKTIALIRSIQFLAEQLKAQVIVEDVDNDEQLRSLRELGCQLMQGKALGEPISQHEIVEKLKVTS